MMKPEPESYMLRRAGKPEQELRGPAIAGNKEPVRRRSPGPGCHPALAKVETR